MGSTSRLHRLIDRSLEQPLADLVAARRSAGVSWRAIAAEVHQETGIEVSHQAICNWFADTPAGVR